MKRRQSLEVLIPSVTYILDSPESVPSLDQDHQHKESQQ